MSTVIWSLSYTMLASPVMLSWFLDHQVKEALLVRKQLVEEEDVEIRPERIPCACLEEDVCILNLVHSWMHCEQNKRRSD